ncbi:serine/threonine protein kinase [Chondromyces apiculatus DSM 436]|uniref:Serine/threonine protein kinase n=1 Tax=Chondromyces apiculatus DSM 436 TaxID=1192034 RepID=A0A017T6N8_9BACT|nr:serine/threonine protein kinase [Chondromyces apiculatus DSM 436]
MISDRYRLVELLARGGMGAVYKAEHLLLRKWVAVKLLHPHTRGLAEHVQRFEREAIAGAHLQHPNIATATDFGKLPDGAYFLVLEYVRGISLRDLMRNGPIDPARAARIARQIASALAAAHQHGIIHRDLKPNNVMLDPAQGDLVKVVDFGLAKVPLDRLDMTDRNTEGRPAHRAITQKNMVFGTVAYMAPEAGGGMDKVDERSDLYALGIILYEMLTGRHPFDATERFELFQQHCTTPPPPFRERAPQLEIAPELEAIVMRLLRKEPPQRFAIAHDLVDALDAAVPQLRPASRSGSSPDLGDIKDLAPSSVRSVLVAPSSSRPDEGALRDLIPPAPPPLSVRTPAALAAMAPPLPAAARGSSPVLPTASTLASLSAQPAASTSQAFPAPQKRGTSRALIAGIAVAAAAIGLVLVFVLPSSSTTTTATDPATAQSGAPTSVPTAATPPPAQDRDRLINAAKHQEWASGEESLIRLIQTAPESLRDPALRQAIPVIASKILGRDDERATLVLNTLDKQLAPEGYEMLYDIAASERSERATERAMDVLHRPDVLPRLSPAIKIALELREAPCKKKPKLFERAVSEGDARLIPVLEGLRASSCKTRGDRCCLNTNPSLVRSLKALRARVVTP